MDIAAIIDSNKANQARTNVHGHEHSIVRNSWIEAGGLVDCERATSLEDCLLLGILNIRVQGQFFKRSLPMENLFSRSPDNGNGLEPITAGFDQGNADTLAAKNTPGQL